MFSLFSFLLFSCDLKKVPVQTDPTSIEGLPEVVDGLTGYPHSVLPTRFPLRQFLFRKREISSMFCPTSTKATTCIMKCSIQQGNPSAILEILWVRLPQKKSVPATHCH